MPTVRLALRVTPKAKQTRLDAEGEGPVRVWVQAPPVDGAANEAVLKLLADRLGLAPSRLTLVRGGHGRDKVVEVEGLTEPQVRQCLRGEAP